MKDAKPNKAVTEKAMNSFLNRGVENVYPSREAVSKMLASAAEKGKKLTIYLGIDPTGPTLHMGHAIPLMKLAELQKMGHQIILLMGDFTAMIGDPTDKSAVRKVLTRKEVMKNLSAYKKQASKIISFGGFGGFNNGVKFAAKIKYNSKWLSKMKFSDVVNLASNVTVQQMLERDMFQKRMADNKPIHLHEFLYPLMQGYDSVAMDVDGEIGGNDQTFNMLAGRDLMRTLKNKEKFVITSKLLVDSAGKKMGKTEGNMIALSDSAQDMFGKVMSWPDTMILPGFELCTRESDEFITRERDFMTGGGNPRDAKMRLAHAVASIYHGTQAADKARDGFMGAFSGSAKNGGVPADAPVANVSAGTLLVDVLLESKTVSSKTDFRRLVGDKAIKEVQSGRIIESFDEKVSGDIDLRVGKHRFIRIKVK